MTVRITASTDGPTKTVRIEGRLDEADLPDLLSQCQSKEGGLKLDLGGLQSADKPGVRALRGLVAEGAKVTRASPYISRVLDIEADSATPGAGSLIP